VISRGTGLNFVNDPFATVGENGETRMKGRRRRWATMGLKGNAWRKKRRERERERERETPERDRFAYSGGGRGERG